MSQSFKPSTWKELKDFCETLSEDELKKNVSVLDGDYGKTVQVFRYPDALYVHKDAPEDCWLVNDFETNVPEEDREDYVYQPANKPFLVTYDYGN